MLAKHFLGNVSVMTFLSMRILLASLTEYAYTDRKLIRRPPRAQTHGWGAGTEKGGSMIKTACSGFVRSRKDLRCGKLLFSEDSTILS